MTPITIRQVNGGWIIEQDFVEHIATDAEGIADAVDTIAAGRNHVCRFIRQPLQPSRTPAVAQDDDAVKGEDEAWAIWSGTPTRSFSGMLQNTVDAFRAALRIAIAANQTQKPMHFTEQEVRNLFYGSCVGVAQLLRSKGATVEWSAGEIK